MCVQQNFPANTECTGTEFKLHMAWQSREVRERFKDHTDWWGCFKCLDISKIVWKSNCIMYEIESVSPGNVHEWMNECPRADPTWQPKLLKILTGKQSKVQQHTGNSTSEAAVNSQKISSVSIPQLRWNPGNRKRSEHRRYQTPVSRLHI